MSGKRGVQFLLVLVFSLVLFLGLVSAGEGDSREEAIELIPGQEVSGNLIDGQDIYYKLNFLNGEDVEILSYGKNLGEDAGTDCEDVTGLQFCNDELEFVIKDENLEDAGSFIVSGVHAGRSKKVERSEEISFLSSESNVYFIQIKATAVEYSYGLPGASFSYKLSYTKQCREGYSDDFMSCEDGGWIQKPVTDILTGEEILASDCGGCLFFGKCFPLRYNFTAADGKSKFCEADGKVYSAKLEKNSCEESYQCVSPLSCADGVCLDMREIKDEESGDTIYAKDCVGCLSEDICYSEGNRFSDDDGAAYFCSIYKTVESQSDEDILCNENYECSSNECSKGKCIDTMGFLESIWSSIKGLFGL